MTEGDRAVPLVWMVTEKMICKWNSGAGHGRMGDSRSRLKEQLAWRPWGRQELGLFEDLRRTSGWDIMTGGVSASKTILQGQFVVRVRACFF